MRISEAEAKVMAVLWQQTGAGMCAEEVVGMLAGQEDWQAATVKTLLGRLLDKGAIEADREGRRYRYRPVLRREEWLVHESQGLLDRWFSGRVAPLVAHFSRHHGLSKRDVAELRRLIESFDEQR